MLKGGALWKSKKFMFNKSSTVPESTHSPPPVPPTAEKMRIRAIHDAIMIAMDRAVIIPEEWINEYNMIVRSHYKDKQWNKYLEGGAKMDRWTRDERICYVAHEWASKENKEGFEFLQDFDYTDMANAAKDFVDTYNSTVCAFSTHVEHCFSVLQMECACEVCVWNPEDFKM